MRNNKASQVNAGCTHTIRTYRTTQIFYRLRFLRFENSNSKVSNRMKKTSRQTSQFKFTPCDNSINIALHCYMQHKYLCLIMPTVYCSTVYDYNYTYFRTNITNMYKPCVLKFLIAMCMYCIMYNVQVCVMR